MTRLTDADDLLLESSGAPVSDCDEIAVLDDRDCAVPDGEPGSWSPEALTPFAATTSVLRKW
jgi:non-ribosomal peptide synthetase component E (peptide arylation enzyme)